MPAVILFYQVFKENAAERLCLCVYVKERACGGGDCHDFAVDVVCVTVHEECS